jgi:hypothetical protein
LSHCFKGCRNARRAISKEIAVTLSSVITDPPAVAVVIEHCWMCNSSFRTRASRFCSARCRDYYDIGHCRQDPNAARAFLALPLAGWRVIAGPPGTTIGESFYGPFLARVQANKQRQKVRAGPRSTNSISVKNRSVGSKACKGAFSKGRSAPGAVT